MANTLRVQVVRTKRTDLLCVHCGHFGSELAIVAPDVAESDAQAGVHRRCIRLVKARRGGVRPPTPAAPVPS